VSDPFGSSATAAPRCRRAWRVLRPHQWIKNLLLFAPLMASHRFMDLHLALLAAQAFGLFCLAASCVYVLNDLHDRDSDRLNPAKAGRPLACGDLSVGGALGILSVLVLALGAALWLLPVHASLPVGVYLLANILYTVRIKEILLLDVFVLASMYVWRVVAGGMVTGIAVSPWLLGFAGFLFLSLAFAKRYAEVVRLEHRGEDSAAGRAWKVTDAPLLAVAGIGCGVGGSIVLALYTTGTSFAALYRNAELTMLLAPLHLYWIARIWIKAGRRELDEDPVLFAARDRTTWLVALAAVGVLVLATV